jgi:hypothetical protein
VKNSPEVWKSSVSVKSVSILTVAVSPDVLSLIPTNSKKIQKKYTYEGTRTPVNRQLKEISKWNTPLISCAA